MVSMREFGSLEGRLTQDGKFVRLDMWRKEGKYVDFWSILHVLSGAAIGFYPRYFHFGMFATFVIVFLLLTMYEMFEVIAKIEEYPTNRVSDVVFGMIGFTPAYFLDQSLGSVPSIVVCTLMTTAAIMLAVVAWTSSYKAFELEKKLRAQVEEQKQKLAKRRDTFVANRQHRKAKRLKHH